MKNMLSKTITSITLFLLAPALVFAQDEVPVSGLENPLRVDTIPEFLEAILEAVQFILAPIIVLMIIYAGFLFVTAQGREQQLTKAKKMFMWAIIGAAIILGARLLANVVENTISNLDDPAP